MDIMPRRSHSLCSIITGMLSLDDDCAINDINETLRDLKRTCNLRF